jgi:DNA-directed RNA polymerase sigma subunit (sigma70/sigma32)
MTYRVSLFSVESKASMIQDRAELVQQARRDRDEAIRTCYVTEGATLQQLADATGLTRQRIQQICSERGESR